MLDLLVSIAGLIVLLPVMAVTAALIHLEDGGPPLFRQRRSGAGLQTFTLLKFRSMPIATEELPSAAARTIQLTRIGRVIRRLNLDELPQLINVMRGEMSIVGPRPALPSQVQLLELRFDGGAAGLKPGLTGLAQINAFDGMSEAEKAKFDVRYCGRVTLIEDLKIIFATTRYLTKRPPIY